MSAKLVECVPNFSEGRRDDVVEKICAAIAAVEGVRLLDKEMDASHNRSVLTMIGSPEAVAEGVFRGVEVASELIDLNRHTGEHPRIGAADVVPFVPLRNCEMADCAVLARQVGKRIAEELKIPVYLYEAAAIRPERENLANVRKGEFEGLREIVGTDPTRAPDYGPLVLHPTAGATAVGARDFLIAYNIYLNTRSVEIAKEIAKAIRHLSGGFRFVKAAGFYIQDRDCAQVSMNLTNYKKTPVHRVLETVRREAARHGVSIMSSEIVGLAPTEALSMGAEFYMQLENFKPSQLIEWHLLEGPLPTPGAEDRFVAALASGNASPGGGSASAKAAEMAAALCEMVARLTIGKAKYSGVQQTMLEILEESEQLRMRAAELVAEDAAAFELVMAAYRIPKEDPQRAGAIEKAYCEAAETPLQTLELSRRIRELANILAEKGNQNARSDAKCAKFMAEAALQGARENVVINLDSISDGVQKEAFTERLRAITGEVITGAS